MIDDYYRPSDVQRFGSLGDVYINQSTSDLQLRLSNPAALSKNGPQPLIDSELLVTTVSHNSRTKQLIEENQVGMEYL